MLPFEVGTVGGLVPNAPFTFISSGVKAESAVQQGLSPVTFKENEVEFGGILSGCYLGKDLYFSHRSFIYKLVGKSISLFAGRFEAGTTETHRYRVSFGREIQLACKGNTIYAADTHNHRILSLSTDGAVKNLAGTGVSGLAADGATAATSQINEPSSMTFDGEGLLIFAEDKNHRIRKIDKNGKLQTVVGGGATLGDTTAAAAQLVNPVGVAWHKDLGVVFSEVGSHRVRVVKDGNVTTLAGIGSHGKSADGATAVASQIATPVRVAVTKSGEVVFSEAFSGVRSIESGLLQTVTGGTYTPPMATYLIPDAGTTQQAIDMLSNPIYHTLIPTEGGIVTNSLAGLVQVGTDNKTLLGASTAVSCSPSRDAEKARLLQPGVLSFNGSGQPFWMDRLTGLNEDLVLQTFETVEEKLKIKALSGCTPGPSIDGIPMDAKKRFDFVEMFKTYFQNGGLGSMRPNGTGLLFANPADNKIYSIANNGVLTATHGTGTAASTGDGGDSSLAAFYHPSAIAKGPSDSLYVIEGGDPTGSPGVGFRIRKIAANGTVTKIAGTGFPWDPTDPGTTPPSTDGTLALAASIIPTAIESLANGEVLFAEPGLIRKIKLDGTIATLAGTGIVGFDGDGTNALTKKVSYVTNLRIDEDEIIWFIDSANSRVRRLIPDGSGGHSLESFYGQAGQPDCATGLTKGTASSNEIDLALQGSLASLCQGLPLAFDIYDQCSSTPAFKKIMISQSFFDFANLVEIKLACTP
jgi:hypothetical protein